MNSLKDFKLSLDSFESSLNEISSLPKFSKKIKELITLQSELSSDLQKIEEQTKSNVTNLAKLDISKLLLQVESIKDSNHNLKAVIEDIQKALAQDANKQQAQLDELQHALKQSHDNDRLQLEYLESQGKGQESTLTSLQDLDKKCAQQLNTILTKQEALQQELNSKLTSLNTSVAEQAKKHQDFNTKLYDLVDKTKSTHSNDLTVLKSKMQEQISACAKDIKSTSVEQQQSLVERLDKQETLQQDLGSKLASLNKSVTEQAKKHQDFNTKLYDLVDKSKSTHSNDLTALKSKMQEQITACAKDIKNTSNEQQQSLVERLNKLQGLQESQHQALDGRIQTISEQVLGLDTKSDTQQKSLLELKDTILEDITKSQQEYQTKVDQRLSDLEKTLNDKFYKQSKNMSMNNSLSMLIVILLISILGLLVYKAFV